MNILIVLSLILSFIIVFLSYKIYSFKRLKTFNKKTNIFSKKTNIFSRKILSIILRFLYCFIIIYLLLNPSSIIKFNSTKKIKTLVLIDGTDYLNFSFSNNQIDIINNYNEENVFFISRDSFININDSLYVKQISNFSNGLIKLLSNLDYIPDRLILFSNGNSLNSTSIFSLFSEIIIVPYKNLLKECQIYINKGNKIISINEIGQVLLNFENYSEEKFNSIVEIYEDGYYIKSETLLIERNAMGKLNYFYKNTPGNHFIEFIINKDTLKFYYKVKGNKTNISLLSIKPSWIVGLLRRSMNKIENINSEGVVLSLQENYIYFFNNEEKISNDYDFSNSDIMFYYGDEKTFNFINERLKFSLIIFLDDEYVQVENKLDIILTEFGEKHEITSWIKSGYSSSYLMEKQGELILAKVYGKPLITIKKVKNNYIVRIPSSLIFEWRNFNNNIDSLLINSISWVVSWEKNELTINSLKNNYYSFESIDFWISSYEDPLTLLYRDSIIIDTLNFILKDSLQYYYLIGCLEEGKYQIQTFIQNDFNKNNFDQDEFNVEHRIDINYEKLNRINGIIVDTENFNNYYENLNSHYSFQESKPVFSIWWIGLLIIILISAEWIILFILKN